MFPTCRTLSFVNKFVIPLDQLAEVSAAVCLWDISRSCRCSSQQTKSLDRNLSGGLAHNINRSVVELIQIWRSQPAHDLMSLHINAARNSNLLIVLILILLVDTQCVDPEYPTLFSAQGNRDTREGECRSSRL